MNYFDILPDEVVLGIFKTVSPKDLSSLKKTCSRFSSLITGFTVRLDYEAIKVDCDVQTESDFKDLILQSKRLKQLSLLNFLRYEDSEDKTYALIAEDYRFKKTRQSSEPALLLECLLSTAFTSKDFARQLAVSCPLIETIEISGIKGLKFVMYYSKACTKVNGMCRLKDIRVYTKDSLKEISKTMVKISQDCPSLRVFKLLRRSSFKDWLNNRHQKEISELVYELSPKLTGFSTNIIDRSLLHSCMTSFTNLTRLVVWTLKAHEVDLLSKSLSFNLRALVLMSVEVSSVQYLYRLVNLTDLTFSLSRQTTQQQVDEAAELFKSFFASAVKLMSLSLVWKDLQSGGCLDYLTKYCESLQCLRIKNFKDVSNIAGLLLTVVNTSQEEPIPRKNVKALLPNLRMLSWTESPTMNTTTDGILAAQLPGLQVQHQQEVVEEHPQIINAGIAHLSPLMVFAVKSKEQLDREVTIDRLVHAMFMKAPKLKEVFTSYKTYVKRKKEVSGVKKRKNPESDEDKENKKPKN